MHRGDFIEAWRQTDRIELPRRECERKGEFAWQSHHLLWNGAPFEGRRVLIRCNHGLGDTLQFVRFIPVISRAAERVTLMAQPPLVRLLHDHPGFGEVRNGWVEGPAGDHDLEIEIMELAYALRVTEDSLSRSCPYLMHHRIHSRAKQLPIGVNKGKMRVGVIWAASEWDPTRSIPVEILDPLLGIPGVEFYSLQQGATGPYIPKAHCPLIPLNIHTTEILEVAAALLQLDLFITVDSMAAHLAGALGRPVWLLLRQNPDWRWMRNRNDSPWYPTMRLFRRQEADWNSVIHEVCVALDQYRADFIAPACIR